MKSTQVSMSWTAFIRTAFSILAGSVFGAAMSLPGTLLAMWRWSLMATLLYAGGPAMAATGPEVILEAPAAVPRFEVAEFVLRVKEPPFQNPFTDAELAGVFTTGNASLRVAGFADSADGSVFRLRFSPATAGASYRYELTFKGSGIDRRFTATLRCAPSDNDGPVVVDPARPKHFMYAGSRRPFYHLGYTAYHLLDPSNDDAQVDATIDYCARHGFNKIRFLLTGYPRDFDRRTSADVEHGVDDPWKSPNYGSKPGQVNPLPAWLGRSRAYDFTRFNVAYWQDGPGLRSGKNTVSAPTEDDWALLLAGKEK